MKFYILASLIIFCMVINHNVRKSRKIQAAEEKRYQERERLANQTRRKPLDGLDYIKIPLEHLPMHLLKEDDKVAECLRMIQELSQRPIVNLTGFSNTDLKLEYGTANITVLTEYDQNYTLLVSTLQQWADLLYRADQTEAAREILEFAVNTRTDVSRTYDLLSDIYIKNGRRDKISELMNTAESLNSLNREVILRHLRERADGSESDR